ncbi:trypsin-like peptidase domain-containing protein [Streptomyces sp. 549]|uniref:S1C family serine protease n=1 Tax=Streptomyces sp. 549 TaxID=3049076 RepID=UPI0024C3477F|nr:trypsin-like peptidase domain-containing protein [Streptomyces sp. 549]MDK1472383.1 trypsin-like peptidase domain-containing protein [Streptomyces sp. 549]
MNENTSSPIPPVPGPGPVPPSPQHAPGAHPYDTTAHTAQLPYGSYAAFPQGPQAAFPQAAFPQDPQPPQAGDAHAAAGHPGGAHRRRARRPVAVLAAVALAAGAIGGGTGALLGTAWGGGSAPTALSAGTNGTNVSTGGTVASVAKNVSPSVVEISTGSSTGSGVVISADGEILTNNHVVSGADRVQVRFSDGSTADATVVGTDADLDMALIKAEGVSGLTPAKLGDSDKVQVGDQVVAIGSPEGLTGSVTSGIISAKDRDVTVRKESTPQQGQEQHWPFRFGDGEYNGEVGSQTTTYKALQTDASLNPGNSGGALLNMNGEVVGINSAMHSAASNQSEAGSIGLGFAVPINDVKQILDDLRAGD